MTKKRSFFERHCKSLTTKKENKSQILFMMLRHLMSFTCKWCWWIAIFNASKICHCFIFGNLENCRQIVRERPYLSVGMSLCARILQGKWSTSEIRFPLVWNLQYIWINLLKMNVGIDNINNTRWRATFKTNMKFVLLDQQLNLHWGKFIIEPNLPRD